MSKTPSEQTSQIESALETMNSPDSIYLAPQCHKDSPAGREWSEDDVWSGKCENCGDKSVRYVRGDIHDTLSQRCNQLDQELNESLLLGTAVTAKLKAVEKENTDLRLQCGGMEMDIAELHNQLATTARKTTEEGSVLSLAARSEEPGDVLAIIQGALKDSQPKWDEQKTRTVNSMCMSWRHDFGLDKRDGHFGSCGMTDAERNTLRAQMGQLFDHHIGPEIAKSERLRAERDAIAKSQRYGQDTVAIAAERDQLQAKVESLQKEAELYRRLRNLPEGMLGASGVPCVAIPDGPKSGRYISGADLDAAMGAAQ